MLKKYKEQYSVKNVQFILITEEGTILETDQAIFEIGSKSNLQDLHPFFYCLQAINDSLDTEIYFNCVNLTFKDKTYISDITFVKKPEGILVSIADFTTHYNSYQKIAQARNESIITTELIAIKNAELEVRENFKNTFIRNFSHELRNPLTSIISITKILAGTELSPQQRTMVDFLNESNNNLKLLLNDILSISLISSGRLKLREAVFSLDELLKLISFTYQTKAQEKGLLFSLKKEPKVPDIMEGDRLRLYQVITNLLDNALKYTPSGQIHLSIAFNQKRANRVSLRITVTDTGIGIAEENKEAIFESFSQINSSAGVVPGTGLGLSIVKGLLELMGSKINVASVLNGGSSFYFDLVLKQPLSATTKGRVNKESKKKKYAFKTSEKYHLLLVEDDINVQTVLFKFLLDTNHFFIDIVSDGGAVMEQLINNEYDIILMDINLPNVSGDEVARLIREFPFKNIKKIPIIGLTAYSYQEDVTHYRQAGINAIISKPYDHDELLETLAKYLN